MTKDEPQSFLNWMITYICTYFSLAIHPLNTVNSSLLGINLMVIQQKKSLCYSSSMMQCPVFWHHTTQECLSELPCSPSQCFSAAMGVSKSLGGNIPLHRQWCLRRWSCVWLVPCPWCQGFSTSSCICGWRTIAARVSRFSWIWGVLGVSQCSHYHYFCSLIYYNT